MLHKILAYLAKIDNLSSFKQDKITSDTVIRYNDDKTLQDFDLVYWKKIKDKLAGSGTMTWLGDDFNSENDLPDVDIDNEGAAAGIDGELWIVTDGEWQVYGDQYNHSSEEFSYSSDQDQKFELDNQIHQLLGISVNGVELSNSQFNINSDIEIEVLDELENQDYIIVKYQKQ